MTVRSRNSNSPALEGRVINGWDQLVQQNEVGGVLLSLFCNRLLCVAAWRSNALSLRYCMSINGGASGRILETSQLDPRRQGSNQPSRPDEDAR